MAVPAPSRAEAASHQVKVVLMAISDNPAAWVSMPEVMRYLRPHRSDSAPVAIWPTPHTAGYTATRIPMRSMDMPVVANRIAAWLGHADAFLSRSVPMCTPSPMCSPSLPGALPRRLPTLGTNELASVFVTQFEIL